MTYPECPRRNKMARMDSEGNKTGVQQCAEPSCSEFGQVVTPDVCGSCLVRKAVIQKARKVAAKKPDIAEMASVAKAAPDTKLKGWLPCKYRQVLTVVKCCGTYRELRRCDAKACDQYGQEVTAKICASCPLRRG
jgi:hypothetical protein